MPEDGLRVEVTNAARFDAALAQMARDVTDVSGPLGAAAKELVTRAAANAPKRSGRLAGSHRALPDGPRRARVVADTPYAAAIHWGWPAHGIRRQPWLVATWLRDRRPLDAMAGAIQAGIDKAAAKT